ncbi:hypothetical protein AHiyo8_28100 [Arthrobacter sp. Hiyo8]|nr:hypothetical protein AHiyo8_28100 [Arthrobacter sp. Hiyo8]
MRASHARTPFHAMRSVALAVAIVVLAAGAHVLSGVRFPSLRSCWPSLH